jgi:hypothetical protein
MTLILTCNEIGVTNPHDIVICPINLLPFVVIGIILLISYLAWRMSLS